MKLSEARYAKDYTKWVKTTTNKMHAGETKNHRKVELDLHTQQEANAAINQLTMKFGEPIRNPRPEWREDGKVLDTIWSFRLGGLLYVIHVNTASEFSLVIDTY